MKPDTFAPFVMLRAVDSVRGESVNAGVVLFAQSGILVGAGESSSRLRALHPDFGAMDVRSWAERLQEQLAKYAERLPDPAQQVAMLPLLCQPFVADTEPGLTQIDETNPRAALEHLLEWQVNPRATTVRAKRQAAKRQTRLGMEIQQWLKGFNVFSKKMEDLSKHRVVANYPVSVSSGLYADFAVSNDKLSVMEVLDLRSIDHLTNGARGDAAIKGITLDEARSTATPIAIVAASDYGVARPAIQLIQRYAADTYDLGSSDERTRFAAFMADCLQRKDIVSQALAPPAK